MCAGFGWSNYRSPTDPKDCGRQQGWRGSLQLEHCLLLLRLRPGPLVRGGHGAVCRNYQYHHNHNYNHHPCAAAVCPGGRGKFHRFLKCVPPCRGERKQALQTVGGGSEVSEGAVMFRFIHTFLWMHRF